MFKKLMACAAMALLVVSASAATTNLDTSGLSDAQIAELKSIAAKKVAETAAAAEALLSRVDGGRGTLASFHRSHAASAGGAGRSRR